MSTTGLTAITGTAEALGKAVTALDLGGAEGEASSDAGVAPTVTPPPVQAGLNEMAAAAVERYRRTMRWMLAAFGAVGLVVFGSLPFTDVSKVSGEDERWVVTGLILAALGIGLAVYAVSVVAEPVDASLGELQNDITAWTSRDSKGGRAGLLVLGSVLASGLTYAACRYWADERVGSCLMWALLVLAPTSLGATRHWWDPRQREIGRLNQILTGEAAHLGPGLESRTVRALIARIGDLDACRYLEAATFAVSASDLAQAQAGFDSSKAELEAW